MSDKSLLEQQADLLMENVSGWERSTLARIGKRISKYGKMSLADIKTINNITAVNQDFEAITKELAKATGYNISQIYRMYAALLEEQHLENKPLYDYRNKPFVPFSENIELQALARAYAKATGETMINLAKTKALSVLDRNGNVKGLKRYYTDILDKAVMQISSGATDFRTAMRDTIVELGGSGVRINYGGGVTRRLDTAVRQNLLWGAKRASVAYNELIGEELDCDGYEIDWHSNPRPSHAFMQGKQYCIGESRTVDGVKFIGFEEVDPDPINEEGKSASEALEEYGCLHFKTPIICGVSEPRHSPEELKRLNEKNARTFNINGKEMTGYEASQAMRRLETEVRKQKDIRTIARESGDKEQVRRCNARIKACKAKYAEISEITGISQEPKRMSVPRMPKTSGNPLTNVGNGGIIEEREVEYGIRYGKNSINADMNYINSDRYANKFSTITDNDSTNQTILNLSRKSIEHRTGTKIEDMYIIDARSGKILGYQTEMTEESGITYNESIRAALKRSKEENIPIIAIHNHPEGLPPSIDDLNKAFDNDYQAGIACGHNGQVYVYKKPLIRIPNEELFHNEIAYNVEILGFDVDRAYRECYNILGLTYEIMPEGE